MSWLRLDDGFVTHPKILELTPAQRWTWLEILSYCARYKTGGRLPANLHEVISGASKMRQKSFQNLGLIDEKEGVLFIHDWYVYNPKDPTAAERAMNYRDRHGITHSSQIRRDGERDASRDASRDENVTTRACIPSPSSGSSYVVEGSNVGVAARSLDEAETAELVELLGRTDWTAKQLATVDDDPARALAWLRHAWNQSGLTSPSGFAWKGFSSGEWPVVEQKPDASQNEKPRPDPSKRCDSCGEKLGYGHLDDCPTLVKAADSALAELPSDDEKAEMAKHAATLLESLVHKQAL